MIDIKKLFTKILEDNAFKFPAPTGNTDVGVVDIGTLHIEWGYEAITTGSTAQSGLYLGQTSIAFDNNFKYAPSVHVTWSGNYVNQSSVSSSGRSVSGFTINARTTTANSTRNVCWLAVGIRDN